MKQPPIPEEFFDSMKEGHFDASAFFETLADRNRLARENRFLFCRVSDLSGFEEAVNEMQSASNFICVSDVSDGFLDLNNTPRTRTVKTVFFAMRHKVDDMNARAECFAIMREIFRQFMSVMLNLKMRLQRHGVYLDERINFNEIPDYFFTGAAGCYFQLAVDVFTDICWRADEWDIDEIGE